MDVIHRKNPRRWALMVFALFGIYVFVKLLPKPEWICNDSQIADHSPVVNFALEPYLQRLFFEQTSTAKPVENYYIDTDSNYVISMFPLYKGLKHVPVPEREETHNDVKDDPEVHVHVFFLRNLNFTNFGRTWSNEVPHFTKPPNDDDQGSPRAKRSYRPRPRKSPRSRIGDSNLLNFPKSGDTGANSGNDPKFRSKGAYSGNDPKFRSKGANSGNDPKFRSKGANSVKDPEFGKDTDSVNGPKFRGRGTNLGNDRPSAYNGVNTQNGRNRNRDIPQVQKQREDLPDCVPLRVPPDTPPTRICVHSPRVDNMISNGIRDTGEWEGEHVANMREFFQKHPHSQLVDLGCNVGVFSMSAASLGLPVLAVDILPANLALLRLSMAFNDATGDGYDLENRSLLDYIREHPEREEHKGNESLLANSSGVYRDSSSGVYRDRQTDHNITAKPRDSARIFNENRRPKYSELITTLHNAVYNRRRKMVVYFPDHLNLGGTEVHELTPVPPKPSKQSGQNAILRKIRSVTEDVALSPSLSGAGRHKRTVDRGGRGGFKQSQKEKLSGKHLRPDRYNKKAGSLKISSSWLKLKDTQSAVVKANPSPHADVVSGSNIEEKVKVRTDAATREKNSRTGFVVDAVCLDDLIPYLRHGRAVFLKMDVEGSESKILRCASRFFMEVDVRVILMEMIFHKHTPEGKQMVLYLQQHYMLPSADVSGKNLLDPDHLLYWPPNVYWLKTR
ncbi:uncharacterized protein LOC101856678 [Aplysia californica]|uniref:Uncharacterized protein LOC101856678 n=1 Tax=Aplysia californica TaxID=6500 RepID=A0ABM0JZF2_APLCA|nr:uncharacterized protein LOC101856678 [Aplysia californica]